MECGSWCRRVNWRDRGGYRAHRVPGMAAARSSWNLAGRCGELFKSSDLRPIEKSFLPRGCESGLSSVQGGSAIRSCLATRFWWIEDNADVLETLGRILMREVICPFWPLADSGQTLFDNAGPARVITDILMPEGEGSETINQDASNAP